MILAVLKKPEWAKHPCIKKTKTNEKSSHLLLCIHLVLRLCGQTHRWVNLFLTQHSAYILGPVRTYLDIFLKTANKTYTRRAQTKMAVNSLIFAGLCLSQGACTRNLCMLNMSKSSILESCLCMRVNIQN